MTDTVPRLKPGPSRPAFGLIQGSGEWNRPYEWDFTDWIPRASVGFFGGPSRHGKTYAVIELMGGLITGQSIFGGNLEPARTGAVMYHSPEGMQGMDHRLEAWRRSRNVDSKLWDSRMLRSEDHFTFTQCGSKKYINYLQQVQQITGETIVSVVFDTFRNHSGAEDENGSADMQNAIEFGRRAARAIGCTVYFIHHSKKQSNYNGLSVGADPDDILRGSNDAGSSAEFVLGVVKQQSVEGTVIPWLWSAKLKDRLNLDAIPMPIETYLLPIDGHKAEPTGVIARDIDSSLTPEIKESKKPKAPSVIENQITQIEKFILKSVVPVHLADIRAEVIRTAKSKQGEALTPDGAKTRASRVIPELRVKIQNQKLDVFMNKNGDQFYKEPLLDK